MWIQHRLPGYMQMQKRGGYLAGTCQVNKDGVRMFAGLARAGRQVTQGADRQLFLLWKRKDFLAVGKNSKCEKREPIVNIAVSLFESPLFSFLFFFFPNKMNASGR